MVFCCLHLLIGWLDSINNNLSFYATKSFTGTLHFPQIFSFSPAFKGNFIKPVMQSSSVHETIRHFSSAESKLFGKRIT